MGIAWNGQPSFVPCIGKFVAGVLEQPREGQAVLGESRSRKGDIAVGRGGDAPLEAFARKPLGVDDGDDLDGAWERNRGDAVRQPEGGGHARRIRGVGEVDEDELPGLLATAKPGQVTIQMMELVALGLSQRVVGHVGEGEKKYQRNQRSQGDRGHVECNAYGQRGPAGNRCGNCVSREFGEAPVHES